jgi:hypothetical protein
MGKGDSKRGGSLHVRLDSVVGPTGIGRAKTKVGKEYC